MAERHETTVTGGLGASIPADIRRRLGVEPGDVVEWELDGSRVTVRFKKRGRRGFADFRPFDFGRRTNAAVEHDEVM